MAALRFALVDEDTIPAIPAPARPGARCQTCDYWERLDGAREHDDSAGARDLKRNRLMAGAALAGSYGMLAWNGDDAVGFAQFGPLSAYPRAQSIRERYPDLPDSPSPWVITCLQVVPDAGDRETTGYALLEAVCADLDGRGIIAVEAYPESAIDPWQPSPGPASVYLAAGFSQAAGDERYPVYRRELGSASAPDPRSAAGDEHRPAFEPAFAAHACHGSPRRKAGQSRTGRRVRSRDDLHRSGVHTSGTSRSSTVIRPSRRAFSIAWSQIRRTMSESGSSTRSLVL